MPLVVKWNLKKIKQKISDTHPSMIDPLQEQDEVEGLQGEN